MTARLSEVLDALAAYGHLLVAPTVERDRQGVVVVTLTVRSPTVAVNNDSDVARVRLETLGLYDEMRYVVDMAQMRALAERYDIAPEKLEALLPRRGEGGA